MNNNFNFEEEMVYNKKHVNIVNNYDKSKYDFRMYIKECFNVEIDKLDQLHELGISLGYNYDVHK